MILDLDDIATLWKVERQYAVRKIVRLPDFPLPIKGSTRKNPRWLRRDILAFLGITEAA